MLQVIKHSYPARPWLWENCKIRHRAVICYLGLKGKTTKQVYQDMKATLGEDALSYSMVKKWAGKFKRGRESLQDNPRPAQTLEAGHFSKRHPFWSSTTLNWLTPEFISELIIEVCFKYFTSSVSFVLDRWINAFDPDSTKGWPSQMNGEYWLWIAPMSYTGRLTH